MSITDFSQFKADKDLVFEFQLEDKENAKIYKAKTTNMELLLIQELSMKKYENEADRTLDMFKIFLGEEDGTEVFNKVSIEGMEEILIVLISKVSGVNEEEFKKLGKEIDSPR